MTEANAAPASTSDLDILWERAWGWLWDCLSVFGEPDEIASTGLTRRVALIVRNWLWTIEGAARRLVLASAFKLMASLPAPKPACPAGPPSDPKDTPRKRGLSSFRFFSIRWPVVSPPRAGTGEGATSSPAPAPYSKLAWRHAAFCSDPLLVIGQAEARRLNPPRRSRPNVAVKPRRGRRSRWDPLYVRDEASEAAAYNRYLFGPFRESRDITLPDPPRRPPSSREQWLYGHAPVIGFDREAELKAEAEAKILHPAPGIARRLAALKRLMENPRPVARRLALRLRRHSGLAAQLAGSIEPVLRKARTDKTPPPPAQDLVAKSCVVLRGVLPPDSS